MLCGAYTKIWPEPSKSFIGTSANSFSIADVQYKIKTPFKNVEFLLESAFSIFMEEIKDIFHSSDSKTEKIDKISSISSSSTSSLTSNNEHSSTLDYKINSNINRDNIINNNNKRHNLTTVNIFLNVIKTSEIHLSLSTDECYNLTMISKLYKIKDPK